MPTYQYACTACDERLEVVQSFSDAALTECPACGGSLRKVFSAVGVVFKGSGFYKTDSRAGGGTKTESKPEAPAASGGSESSNGSTTGSTTGTGSGSSTTGSGSGSGGSGSSGSGNSGSGGSSTSAPKVSAPASKSA